MPRVLVPLAEGFEDMEAVTIVDILRRAEINTVTAGLVPGAVKGARGLVVQPDACLDEVKDDDFDLIALPGGQPGVTGLRADPRILELLKKMQQRGKCVAAICAAPMVLADAGLLNGKKATAYPGTLESMAVKDMTFEESTLVEDGNIVTSRGPGTSVDFALALVARLAGHAKRQEVEERLMRPA